jgi:hypothetical protein
MDVLELLRSTTLDVFVQVWYSKNFSLDKCLVRNTTADDNIQKITDNT